MMKSNASYLFFYHEDNLVYSETDIQKAWYLVVVVVLVGGLKLNIATAAFEVSSKQKNLTSPEKRDKKTFLSDKIFLILQI